MPVSSDISPRLPAPFRKSLLSFKDRRNVYQILRQGNLATVCEEARCPNIGECFSNNTATFMIMGDRCTRRCKFCAVTTKKPMPLDEDEPQKVAHAALTMGLDYVVVTSVDRDDLPDFGARHFVRVVDAIKTSMPHAKVELLVPDFKGKTELLDEILASPVDVFGHNIESVDRLYKAIRPQSELAATKKVLAHASACGTVTKSGMMVGLGESDEEVLDTLSLLFDLGVSIATIGQYLRPTRHHWAVERYVGQDSYKKFVEHGLKVGLRHVFAGPFVRSSYHAKEAHQKSMA